VEALWLALPQLTKLTYENSPRLLGLWSSPLITQRHPRPNSLKPWKSVSSFIGGFSPKPIPSVRCGENPSIRRILTLTWALGVVPSKFVLCGDSAGGNLATAVTYKAIQQNLRLPDSLVLAYPAMDLTKFASFASPVLMNNSFANTPFNRTATPSRVLFSTDVLLPYYFMMVCLEAYSPEPESGVRDFLLSPLYAPTEILRKLPDNLVIFSAGYDPLLDDSVRFLKRHGFPLFFVGFCSPYCLQVGQSQEALQVVPL